MQKPLRGWLEYVDPSTKTVRRIEIEDDALTIGRVGNGLKLADGLCSEIHAVLCQEGGCFILRDLSSETGTFVNDQAVIEVEIHHLDQIKIGTTTLTFKTASHQERRPLNPLHVLLYPIRFWRRALSTALYRFDKTWPFHL